MNAFWDVFPVIIIFPTIGLIVKWVLEYRLKKDLIEKGMVDEKVKYLSLNTFSRSGMSSLKWGLVALFVGIGIIAIRLFPYYIEGEVVLGVMLISAGAALLLYYFIANTFKSRQLPGKTENSVD